MLKKIRLTITLFILAAVSPLYAEMNGFQIAEKAYNIEDGYDAESVMMMKIVKTDGSEKKRDLKFYRKDYGTDNRTLIVFQSPADVKDTSFLTWNFASKENDQWLYLPALKQVTRISASSKSKSFMNSDFSYEDLSKRSLKDDDYTFLKEDKNGSDLCYLVQALSKDKSEKLSRRLFWIRKDNFVIVKVELYNSSNLLVKRFTASDVKLINNIWTVLKSKMENMDTKGFTTLELSAVKYNTGLAERLFKKEGMGKK